MVVKTVKVYYIQGCGSSKYLLLPLPAPYKVTRFRVYFRFQLLQSASASTKI